MNKENVKQNAGLWIDHREAIIVVLMESGDVTTNIKSAVEKQLRRASDSPGSSFESQAVPADDSREREYMGHLAQYYSAVVLHLADADAIMIMGPGEAKGELRKRFEKNKNDRRIVAVEKADKMTEPQIVAHVRHYFHRDATRRTAS